MSVYASYVTAYWFIWFLILLLREGRYFGPVWLFGATWLFPISISQFTGLALNEEWALVTFIASSMVVFGFMIGYSVPDFILQNRLIRTNESSLNISKLLFTFLVLGVICTASFLYLYFVELGRPPLFSENISVARRKLLTANSLIFSFSQTCNIFGVIFGVLWLHGRLRSWVKLVWSIVLVLLILSGWRNVILTYLTYSVTPYLIYRRPKISKVLVGATIFLVIFSIIGFLRGDQGSQDRFYISAALELVSLYIYPNFLNFESLVQIRDGASSLHTVQFLLKPILDAFGFSISPPQTAIGAFNVSTGLWPLYRDGGIINIFIVFLLMGMILNFLRRASCSSIIVQFSLGTILSTLVLLHNGWFLLNYMYTYSILVYFLISLVYLIIRKRTKWRFN